MSLRAILDKKWSKCTTSCLVYCWIPCHDVAFVVGIEDMHFVCLQPASLEYCRFWQNRTWEDMFWRWANWITRFMLIRPWSTSLFVILFAGNRGCEFSVVVFEVTDRMLWCIRSRVKSKECLVDCWYLFVLILYVFWLILSTWSLCDTWKSLDVWKHTSKSRRQCHTHGNWKATAAAP